jgi:hypothetical protein
MCIIYCLINAFVATTDITENDFSTFIQRERKGTSAHFCHQIPPSYHPYLGRNFIAIVSHLKIVILNLLHLPNPLENRVIPSSTNKKSIANWEIAQMNIRGNHGRVSQKEIFHHRKSKIAEKRKR